MGRLRSSAQALLVALAVSVPCPAQADPDKSPDYFIDPSGGQVAFRPVYEGWFGDARTPPHYFRAVMENAGLLGLELFIYWYDPSSNVVDWQFPDVGWKLSSSDSVRFDDNMPRTNWLLHPLAGATHYGATRLNGFGVPASFAAAALSSGIYEVMFEWREVVSINDLIVTPLGGMALGEFLFHLGDYLNSQPARPRTLDEVVGPAAFGSQVSAGTLGFATRLHSIADTPPPPPPLAEDDLGLSSAYAHRFRLLLGQDVVTNDRQTALGNVSVVFAEAELAAMPGFLRPGRFSTWFSQGNFTSLDVRVAFDDSLRDLDVLVDAHLFGHFAQRFDAVAEGVSGVAREIAVRTGFHYVDRWLLDRRDHYDVLHVLGPIGTVWLASGSTIVRLATDVSPDFAAPRSLAYQRWGREFGTVGTKSSLLSHGYYHGWGVSAGASAGVSSHGLSADARARYGHYESLDGAERAREPVTREVHASDDVLELAGSLSYRLPGTMVSTGVTAAHVRRVSKMAPITTAWFDERAGVVIGLEF